MTFRGRIPRTLLVSLVIAMLPSTSALTIEDPSGDVQLEGANDPGIAPEADLLRLTFEESEDALQFILKAERIAADGDVIARYATGFTYHDQAYQWVADYNMDPTGGFYNVRLFKMVEPVELIAVIETSSWDDTSVTVDVPRNLITDARGAPLFIDRAFHSFRSTAAYISDRNTPTFVDELQGDDEHVLQYGAELGSVLLASTEPIRSSNGEAATFVFHATATSDEETTLPVAVDYVPNGWTVNLPVDLIEVVPGEVANIPVIVEVPRAHKHGSTETFELQLGELDKRSTLRMGVHFLDIPQPSGHHPTIYLHAIDDPTSIIPGRSGTEGFMIMNTWAEDPRGMDQGQSGVIEGEPGAERYRWVVPLIPQLEMGLRFDGNGIAKISLPLEHDVALDGLVEGQLLLQVPSTEGEGDWPYFSDITRPLYTFEAVASSDGVTDIEMLWAGESDEVSYLEGQNLVLDFTLEMGPATTYAEETSPDLMPGAWLNLPLLDYHDPVDQLLVHGPHFTVSQPVRLANPGTFVQFQLAAEERIDGEVFGLNSDWAAVSPSATGLTITVGVPADTAIGSRADLIVGVTSPNMEGKRLVRLVVDVVEKPVADATPIEQGGQTTPSAGVLVALAALLLARKKVH